MNVATFPYRVVDNRTGETIATYKTFLAALKRAGKENRLHVDGKPRG